ncbi:MAG: AAA family ATPase, partial [Pseudomonadota bacterium]
MKEEGLNPKPCPFQKMSAKKLKSAQPWVEKYRPSSLDELVAHADIIAIIKKLIAEDRLPHMLLYGPPGTGKTSTITAAAKDMYGKAYGAMTLELNASDERGIGVVRNQIKEFAGTKSWYAGVKLVILDEADMMTNDAQFALRRVIEKYTANTRFCLVCNYANKIIPALQSRCTKFRFAPLEPDQIRDRLDSIIQAESLVMPQRARDALLELGGGDMRRVLNILQATAV